MDAYFTRLAQRSDVAPVTSAPRTPASAAPTASDGLEQHLEVSVPPLAASVVTTTTLVPMATDTTADAPAPSASPAPSAPGAPRASRPTAATAIAQCGAPPQAAIEPALSVPDAAPQHAASAAAIAQPDTPQATATAAPLDVTGTQAAPRGATATAASSSPAPHALAAPVPAPVPAPVATVTPRAAYPVRADFPAQDGNPTTLPAGTAQARSLPPAAPAEVPPATRRGSAAPQVHIGRIELEIRPPAPAPRVAAMPAALSADSASARPNRAAFNPHRHYLRGV